MNKNEILKGVIDGYMEQRAELVRSVFDVNTNTTNYYNEYQALKHNIEVIDAKVFELVDKLSNDNENDLIGSLDSLKYFDGVNNLWDANVSY